MYVLNFFFISILYIYHLNQHLTTGGDYPKMFLKYFCFKGTEKESSQLCSLFFTYFFVTCTQTVVVTQQKMHSLRKGWMEYHYYITVYKNDKTWNDKTSVFYCRLLGSTELGDICTELGDICTELGDICMYRARGYMYI